MDGRWMLLGCFQGEREAWVGRGWGSIDGGSPLWITRSATKELPGIMSLRFKIGLELELGQLPPARNEENPRTEAASPENDHQGHRREQ